MSRTAILKERQVNPVSGALLHLDFIQVFMDVAIEVTVPLEFVGKPAGVDKGGTFQAAARDLRVACLPSRIPEVIEVDVSGLEIGHSIHIGEISLPPGVDVVQDKGTALATVLAPKRPEEMVAAEVAEAAEPGEKPAAEES
jgi:large subunit ribosomal protein L25